MTFWKTSGLRTRVFIIMAAIVMLTIGGGATTLWYAGRMDILFHQVIERDVIALRAAEELNIELVKQKGFTSYYYLDHDPQWLSQIQEHHEQFLRKLEKARASSFSNKGRSILEKVEAQYKEYNNNRNRVLEYYRNGQFKIGEALHKKVRFQFFDIVDLCDEYGKIHKTNIAQARREAGRQARSIRAAAWAAMGAGVLLAGLLTFVLGAQILSPLRRLSEETDRITGGSQESRNEVASLKHGVHGLIHDMDQTRTELARSRELLMDAEKMALVGKLAAEVAHSIRNPMTSINMRLFSLKRSQALSPEQYEDLDVVAGELNRLENIVQNFLNFSRPPRLEMQGVQVSEIIDMTLQLLQQRLEKENIEIVRHSGRNLPPVSADSELLKEVFVNLIVNACEAMDSDGGRIAISEEEAVAEDVGRAVVVRISDNGPGITTDVIEQVFEPFFTTKSDGTGLGLSIALRVLREHNGHLDVHSTPSAGTTFIITLPAKEGNHT